MSVQSVSHKADLFVQIVTKHPAITMEDNTRTPLDSVQVDEVDLDEYVDRTQVPALKSLCQRGDTTLFAAGVADMDFKAAPVIRRALRQRLAHGVV